MSDLSGLDKTELMLKVLDLEKEILRLTKELKKVKSSTTHSSKPRVHIFKQFY